jgi:hypothetical protein
MNVGVSARGWVIMAAGARYLGGRRY